MASRWERAAIIVRDRKQYVTHQGDFGPVHLGLYTPLERGENLEKILICLTSITNLCRYRYRAAGASHHDSCTCCRRKAISNAALPGITANGRFLKHAVEHCSICGQTAIADNRQQTENILHTTFRTSTGSSVSSILQQPTQKNHKRGKCQSRN